MNNRSSHNYPKKLLLTRPTMINITQKIKAINISNRFYLLEESSDDEDGYNEETKQTMPSLIKVSKNIFDPNLIMILTDIKYFPKEAQPGLIITGIENWVTEKHIKYFLKEVPAFKERYKNNNNNRSNNEDNLDINSIKFFVQLNKRYAYVKLNNFNHMEIIGNFFLNPIKKEYPSYNSKKEKIEVYYAYDLLKITKNHWYGVILRNLPPNCNDRSIYKFTDQKIKNGVKYCLNPILVDDIYCALVVCKELEFAERLCNDLNNTEINNKYMKAHLHPKICKIRNKNLLNDYDTFNKNGYKFTEEVEESEKCLEFAKPFMEFFHPDYFNSFNNNGKSKKKEEENKNMNDTNDNNKKNKEKEKNNKIKTNILASSILDYISRNKSYEDLKKVNNKNLNSNNDINNNNTNNNEKETIKNNIPENSSNPKLPQINNIQSSMLLNKDSSMTLDIKNSNSNILSQDNNKSFHENKNINNNKEKENLDDINKKNEKENNDIIKYSEQEINYYTYNMGDEKYYEEKEFNEQRKKASYNNQRTNYNYRENNYRNNYKNNYSNKNSFNKDYRSYRYEHNKISSSPRHYYNTSYKKNNSNYPSSFKDKDYNDINRRKYDNYKERSKEKNLERSREQSYDKESLSYKNKDNAEKDKDKRHYYDYNKNYNINRRDEREKEWDRNNINREDNHRKYSDERNRGYNDNKYENKYDNKYENKYENRYINKYDNKYDNKYYERNNNNYNNRRKESYHHSRSRQKNERNDRNERSDRIDREKRERYYNNNYKDNNH